MSWRSIKALVALCHITFWPLLRLQAAQEFQVVADATEYSLTVGAEQIADPFISLLFVSAGSETTAVMMGIDGPAGLRGEVDGARIPSGAAISSDALQNSPLRESYPLRLIAHTKQERRFEIDQTGEGGVVQFIYHLQKDACKSDTSARYVSRVLLDFSNVHPEKLTQGITLRFALQEHRYQGSRVASIKPAADGKYRGEPILLMESIQYGGEYVNIIQRGKRGVRLRRRLPVVKYVFHRGYTLSLARLRGSLRGGKATFEISNGGAVYAVCFFLERRRQVANGYPL
jgi:hypothetical protein